MKNLVVPFQVLCLLIITWGCSTNDPHPTTDILATPKNIVIIDYGNQGDGRDIYLSFQQLPDEKFVEEYRLILVKSGDGLSYDAAMILPEDRRYAVQKKGSSIAHQIQNNFNDSEGDPIENDQSYTAYILTVSNSETRQGSLSSGRTIQIIDKPYYEVKTLGNTPYPYMEALSYQDGYIIAPGGSNLFKVDAETGSYEIFDSNLPGPLGGGFDPHDGSYYGAMYNGGYVTKYELDGSSSLFASGLVGPIGIAVDDDKNVYVSNFDANIISKVTPAGNKTVFVNNNLGLINGPDGLVMANGDLYSINFWDSRVLKISASGVPSLLTTLPGTGNGYMVFADDTFYATSLSNNQVFKIDLNGNYELLAGSGANIIKDGPAPIASFKEPNGIAISGETIFIGDEGSIRLIIKHE